MLRIRRNAGKKCDRSEGMSLIELMISMVVLVVGMTALLGLIIIAINNNNRSKQDTGGTMAAQLVMETISGQDANANMVVTDCSGANFIVATTAGGANLNANGGIDFAGQTYAAVPGNYKMQYRSCGPAGRVIVYDVRWNIQAIDQFSKLVTVSARPAAATGLDNTGRGARMFQQPVTLKSFAVAGN